MNIQSNESCRILVFGPQALKIGGSEVWVRDMQFPIRVSELTDQLAIQYPALETSIAISRLAVNQEFAAAESWIQADDEVALIGLISGG